MSTSMTRRDPRDASIKHAFLSEIEHQAELAAHAAERLATWNDHKDSVEMWRAVQSVLAAAANVSKILWPRKKYAQRGKMMRELLNISDDSPLHDRSFRNYFEHFDERIEDWLTLAPSASYTDRAIGSPTGFARDFPQKTQRRYDPYTQTLSVRGESMNLGSVLKALEEIAQRCKSTFFL